MSDHLRAIDAEPPCAGTVTVLEEVLERARNGELSSVAVASVYRDGSSDADWSHAHSYSCLIGAVTRLQFALARAGE